MSSLFASVALLAQLVVGVGALVVGQPRRARFALRLAAGLLVVMAVEAVGRTLHPVPEPGGDNILGTLLRFSATVASFYVAVRLAYDLSPWQALFCCTAGYAAQNLASGTAELLEIVAPSLGADMPLVPMDWKVLVSVLLVYPPYLCLFARGARRNGLVSEQDREIVLVTVVVILAVIGLDAAIKNVPDGAVGPNTALMLRIGHMLTCVFVLYGEYKALYSHQLAAEREVTRRIMAERERQYRLSRENIDAINVKCHDIRHQIRRLADSGAAMDRGALEDIAREVSVYDSVAETGNVALDTILTEMGLVCSSEGITLSVMADGAALGFMEPSDIYSLFGNALDNAIEAVRQLEDRERRVISLSVRRSHNMVVVDVENPCERVPRFEDGLPATTKEDMTNHGFGTRSMRLIAERYGGALKLGVENGVFYVNALLPLPEGREDAG